MTPKTRKYLIGTLLILLLAGGGTAWYLFTATYGDTAAEQSTYTTSAYALIDEFLANDSAANKKYAEQIITVTGRVSSIEPADTTINIKMEHPGGSYISFAFQQQDMAAVKQLKTGDSISVKGSCNGGNYSSILNAEYITFKRSTLNH